MKSSIQGILKIKRVSNSQPEMFTFAFISSSAASDFLSREVKYRGKTLNCFLLGDLVKRLKMESRPRNFRDETRYREQDIDRRILVILKPNTIWKDKDLQRIGFGARVSDLEHVFKCEIDEEHSKSFSGLYILTFKKAISPSSCRPLENDNILYVGLLKDYITKRAHIIKENPIERRVLSRPPDPPESLETDLSAISLASKDQNRFSLELSGFSSVCIDIREYVIKIMKLDHVEQSKDKVSDPYWREGKSENSPIGLTALFSLNVCDRKSEQLIKIWNDKDIKIKDCVIRARIA